MSATNHPIRPGSLALIAEATRHPLAAGVSLRRARGQNFVVDWIDGEAGAEFGHALDGESMLIAPGAVFVTLRHAGSATILAGRTIAILPSGETTIAFQAPGTLIRLAGAAALADGAIVSNAEAYAIPDPAVAHPGQPSTARSAGIRLHAIDTLKAPADKPRLKMLRSADLSINWIEYEGLRDRTALSPHDHADFEQGSLAIMGRFVHHLRVPWGPDATQWQPDRHAEAPPASLIVIPPLTLHTTEGVDPGRHMLVDIFCPPRADFLAKGWIGNANEYD